MLRSLTTVLALGLATAAGAQSALREGLEIMPGRVTGQTPGITGVVRISLTNNPDPAFEALQMYDRRFFQGIGDLRNTSGGRNPASLCEIGRINVRYQDDDLKTSENFKLVFRGESAPGSRVPDRTKTLWTQTVAGWPATPTSQASGLLLSVQIMNPNRTANAAPVPCTETFFAGMEIPTIPNAQPWGVDGLSIIASYADTVPGSTVFDWPKGGHASDYLYSFVWATGTGRFQNRMVFAYNLVPDAPVLQAGAFHRANSSRHGSDLGFGAAGIWPEIDPTTARGRLSTDGVVVRFTDNAATSTSTYGLYAALSTAVGQSRPIIAIPGIGGGLYLGSPSFPVLTGQLKGVDTVITLAPPAQLPTGLLGTTVYMQGFTLVGSRAQLTNLVGVQFKR